MNALPQATSPQPTDPAAATRAAVVAYWAAANARDWAAFGALLAPDVLYEVPQTRETVCGQAAYVAFNRSWPGDWQAQLQTVVAEASQAISVLRFVTRRAADQGGDSQETGISVFRFDSDGLIAHISDHWPAPYEPPPRAGGVVRRMP